MPDGMEKMEIANWASMTAFQSAVALAEYTAKTANPPKQQVMLTKKHLEGVADMSDKFKTYMKDFKGRRGEESDFRWLSDG